MIASRYVRIIVAIGLYWFVSITMVFLNKFLLSYKEFDIPLTITWSQCIVTTLLSIAIGSKIGLNKSNIFNQQINMQIIPLSLIFVGMITLNNLTLKYINVSFYLVGRSLTTVFNVIFSKLLLNQSTSMRCQLACAIIVVGFLLGIDQEIAFGIGLTMIGLVCAVGSSLCVALNSIFTKKYLTIVQHSPFRLTYVNNLNSCFLFLPLLLFTGEVSNWKLLMIPTNGGTQVATIYSCIFWMSMFASGILGFAISFVSINQIEATSPLTHVVSGTAKAYIQTVIAVIIWSEQRSFLWWLSSIAVLVGSALYAYFRTMEMQDKHQSEAIEEHSKSSTANNIV
ncbi:hypothetical protein GJ496_005261 [Pomphorhynchus laevis]|nr:hypothetical protein GJ496_005261 [Pomphorhynchus laevis]